MKKTNTTVDVIIPVYDGFEETKACIESVLGSINHHPFRTVVVNDASPNPKLTQYLRDLAEKQLIELHENKTNLGFVGTVNKGMRLHPDRDVILQNSDTIVANNWIDRIIEWAYRDNKVASVTPFSTNAEICSYPTLCKANELVEGYSVAQTDALFAELADRSEITLPTGVGFSMYIRRDALNHIGYFDEEAFGRGYGEENDWCRRAIAKGYRHLLATNVFVFHEGGVSFSDQKKSRVENALRILDQRYPDYHREVHQHIQANPARAIREKIQLDMLQRNGKRKLLYVTHHMGGGIQTHIEEMQMFFRKQCDILLLRPSTLDGKDVELSYQSRGYNWSIHFSLEHEWSLLLTALRSLSFERVHFHHLMRVPEKIWTVAQILNLEYDVTLHDYYMVNGNPTLTDGNGLYVENPADREAKCAEHYPVPMSLTLNQWHQKMKNFLMGASRVFSPSQACADIYNFYFAELKITVVYHVDSEDITRYPDIMIPKIAQNEKLRIAVIGAISREKGADVFEHTACHKDPLDRLEFHLIGYAYKPLRETVTQHGAYKNEDLAGIIKQVNPHIIWFPAQWPETYCYVLTAAMQVGLPILATNLGSFPERLEGRPASYVQSWNLTPEQWKNLLIQLRENFIANIDSVLPWDNTPFGKTHYRYPKNYLKTEPVKTVAVATLTLEQVKSLCVATSQHHAQNDNEKMLRVLWRLREMPVMRQLQRLVPFEVQRRVKRALSQRPIHDIMNEK
jgi:GT2 family glycosyltransferase/glycosyltransferase involved in cell wall biosynthesis